MGGGHQFIDALGENRRLLVAVDGRIKLVLLLAALAVNLTVGGVRVPLALAGLSLGLVTGAGVRSGAFLRRMAVPLLLAATAFVSQLLLFRAGEVLLQLPVLQWEWTITSGGLERGLELAARIVGGMGVLLFFALTTPLPELMRAARFFRCPAVLVELALIMYRYVFLLLEEGERIRNAQRARLGYVSVGTALRSAGTLGGMLILRTYDRAERSFAAMRCRGYRGVTTALPPGRVRAADWGVLVAGLGVLGLLYVIR